jgi:hypothetical protein
MFRALRQIFAQLLERWPGPDAAPEDPYAGVRHPRRRGPAGRSSAVAVEEPEPDSRVDALGRFRDRRGPG